VLGHIWATCVLSGVYCCQHTSIWDLSANLLWLESGRENGLQSSQPKFRRIRPLVYILITTKQSMRVIHTTLITMTVGAWETGSTNSGTTPGGGFKNGVWERSMWEGSISAREDWLMWTSSRAFECNDTRILIVPHSPNWRWTVNHWTERWGRSGDSIQMKVAIIKAMCHMGSGKIASSGSSTQVGVEMIKAVVPHGVQSMNPCHKCCWDGGAWWAAVKERIGYPRLSAWSVLICTWSEYRSAIWLGIKTCTQRFLFLYVPKLPDM